MTPVIRDPPIPYAPYTAPGAPDAPDARPQASALANRIRRCPRSEREQDWAECSWPHDRLTPTVEEVETNLLRARAAVGPGHARLAMACVTTCKDLQRRSGLVGIQRHAYHEIEEATTADATAMGFARQRTIGFGERAVDPRCIEEHRAAITSVTLEHERQ